jgi:hypothetical protein
VSVRRMRVYTALFVLGSVVNLVGVLTVLLWVVRC